MRKFGFTLSEVLVTFGIISILAVITLPRVVNSTANRANIANLSGIVSNLETAFEKAINSEGAQDLSETEMWSYGGGGIGPNDAAKQRIFFNNLKRYYGKMSCFRSQTVQQYYGNETPRYMSANGDADNNNNNNVAWGNLWPIELSNGAVMFISVMDAPQGAARYTEAGALTQGTTIQFVCAEIDIDANGLQSPNVVGRDIFRFHLSVDGKLYPHGGLQYSRYGNGPAAPGNDNNIWSNARAAEGFSCVDGAISQGWGCTARLFENGLRMDY